jgi:hypothetical protein
MIIGIFIGLLIGVFVILLWYYDVFGWADYYITKGKNKLCGRK